MPTFMDDTQIRVDSISNGAGTGAPVFPVGLTSSAPTRLVAGTAVAPALAFTANTNLGIFRKAADSLGFSTQGIEIGSFDLNGSWTMGPAAGLGATGNAYHLMYGSLVNRNTNGGFFVHPTTVSLAANNYRDGSGTLKALDTATGASLIEFRAVSSGASNCLSVYSSITAQTANTALGGLSEICTASAAGAWTFGPSGFSGAHRLNATLLNFVRGANTQTTLVGFTDADGSTYRCYLGLSRADGTGIVTGGTANSFVLRADNVDMQFAQSSTLVGNVTSSGAWTFGNTSWTQTKKIHTFNGTVFSNSRAGNDAGMYSSAGNTSLASNIYYDTVGNNYKGLSTGTAWLYEQAPGSNATWYHQSVTADTNIAFTVRMSLSTTGQLSTNTGTIGTVSDVSLKENVIAITGALNIISQLNPVRYDWVDNRSAPNLGFIAQEVEAVEPLWTSQDELTGLKSVCMGVSTFAVIVKAIQELNAKLDIANAKIAALQGTPQ